MSFVLACDLGGTSLRLALIDRDGRLHAVEAVTGTASNDVGNRSEIDPALWWEGLSSAADRLAASDPAAFRAVEAVSISGVTRTQVLVGADGRVLRPAITWKDSRAGETLEMLRAAVPPDHPEREHLNAYHPLGRLHWLTAREPEVVAATAAVLEPKDFLVLGLTGRATTDPISSARLIASAAPDVSGNSAFAAVRLHSSLVPQLVEPATVIARVRDGLSGALGRLAGRPVVGMGHDTWASVLGLGALRPGRAYNLSGTTEVFGVMTEVVAMAEGLMTVDWGAAHQLGGPSLSGADTLVWALTLLGRHGGDPKAVGAELDALLAHPHREAPLLFLPYLQGERTPYWNPSLRGALLGLGRRHGPADVVQAVLEGVAYLNRIVLERAEAATGVSVGAIRFGGGGAANPAWCQIKADICGRPVETTSCPEPGLLGAAIAAWTALGLIGGLEEGQARFAKVARRFEPDPHRAARYSELYDLFRAAERSIQPISEALSAFDRVAAP